MKYDKLHKKMDTYIANDKKIIYICINAQDRTFWIWRIDKKDYIWESKLMNRSYVKDKTKVPKDVATVFVEDVVRSGQMTYNTEIVNKINEINALTKINY
jgi:septum formation inhibitor MinC